MTDQEVKPVPFSLDDEIRFSLNVQGLGGRSEHKTIGEWLNLKHDFALADKTHEEVESMLGDAQADWLNEITLSDWYRTSTSLQR